MALLSVVAAMASRASSVKKPWWEVTMTLGKDRSRAVVECIRISFSRFSKTLGVSSS